MPLAKPPCLTTWNEIQKLGHTFIDCSTVADKRIQCSKCNHTIGKLGLSDDAWINVWFTNFKGTEPIPSCGDVIMKRALK